MQTITNTEWFEQYSFEPEAQCLYEKDCYWDTYGLDD